MKPTFSSLFFVLFIAFLTSFPTTSAQSPLMSPSMSPSMSSSGGLATPPAGDCTASLLNMSDCLTYAETGSKLKTPDKGCCPELAGLVDSNPICLCQLLGNSSSFGVQIDQNRALGLPKICQVTTPSVSLCSEVGIPIGAPASSEGSGSISGSPATSPAGSSPPKSDASSITRGSGLLLLAGLSSLALQFIN